MKRKKFEVGKTYTFNSASQIVRDAWFRPIEVRGKHTFTKVKDTLMDRLHWRSWYLMDGWLLVFVTRGGYIELRCLEEGVDDVLEGDR